jgi:hypothetical protein
MGVVLREWSRSRTVIRLAAGIASVILVGAVLSLTYGNHLAELAAATGS